MILSFCRSVIDMTCRKMGLVIRGIYFSGQSHIKRHHDDKSDESTYCCKIRISMYLRFGNHLFDDHERHCSRRETRGQREEATEPRSPPLPRSLPLPAHRIRMPDPQKNFCSRIAHLFVRAEKLRDLQENSGSRYRGSARWRPREWRPEDRWPQLRM